MRFGGLFRRSWRPLGASWSLLGRSWGIFGASGGVFGPLGRLLGRLGADPKQLKYIMPKKTNFKSPQRTCYATWRGGFWKANPIKIGSKTWPNLRRCSTTKKILFQTLLGTSWADLGAFWRSSWGPNMRSGISERNIS